MEIEIWQKYNFSSADYKVWQIFKAYEFFARKRKDFRNYLPVKTDPRNAKNWTYFKSVSENFSKDPMFDPHFFIEAQFRNLPKGSTIYPAQLKSKVAIIKYKEHREAIKVNDTDSKTKRLMENLAATYKFLKKWWHQHNLPLGSYKEFFTKKENEIMSNGMLFCLQGMISKYFMAVSKHFLEEYNKLDSDLRWDVIPPDELKGYKITLKLDQDAFSFAKEIFDNEII
jgi:hypothetical protein